MQAKLSLCKKLGSRRKCVDWQELAYIKTECNMKIRTKMKMSSLAGYINMDQHGHLLKAFAHTVKSV